MPAGTLENAAIELSRSIGSIAGVLAPGQARETLARMGVLFPEPFFQDPGFESARGNIVNGALGLGPSTSSLIGAIEAGDDEGALTAAITLLADIGTLIAGFATLGTAIETAAAGFAGVPAAEVDALVAHFPERFLNLLLVGQLESLPGVAAALVVTGLVEYQDTPAGGPYRMVSLHPQRIIELLTDPEAYLRERYDWGAPGWDGTKLLPTLQEALRLLGLPTRLVPATGTEPMMLEAFAVDLRPRQSPDGLQIDVVIPIRGTFHQALATPHPAWSVRLDADVELGVGGTAFLAPPLQLEIGPLSAELSGEAMLAVTGAPSEPFILIGKAGGSRLEVGGVSAGLGVGFTWAPSTGKASAEPRVRAEVTAGKVVITGSGGDGFIDALLSGVDLQAPFALAMRWSPSAGIEFEGSAGLAIEIPTRVTLGPLIIDALHLGLGFVDEALYFDLAATLGAELGPVVAMVRGMGLRTLLSFPPGGGNIGSAQLDFAFKFPTGAALSIDTSTVKLAGVLIIEPELHRYVGAVEISIVDTFDLSAIAIITTKLPDGTDTFSLLFIISMKLPSPIHIAYNFFFAGAGGLLGLHRSVDLERLRLGLRDGAADNILFPTDVVANLSAIVSDLSEIFPPTKDQFLVGPMVQITWSTPPLLTGEVGLIIEFANPVRIAILGVVKAAIPTKDQPILDLKVAFLGTIDFEKGLLAFDASIYDSSIGVESFRISFEGDLALRICWGDKPDFVLSVGGFHPQYSPPAHLELPPMRRITVSLLKDNPRLKLTAYFALTSNTVQFGAELDFYFGVAGFSVVGNFGFDVLFQFSPFRFIASVRAMLAVRAGSTDLLSLSLSFELQGTSPWIAKGTASFSILFFEVSVRFEKTWGERQQLDLPLIEVLPVVVTELERDVNWKGELGAGEDRVIQLVAGANAAEELFIDPAGSLTISQARVPMGLVISRHGNNRPSDIQQVDVVAVRVGTVALGLSEVQEQFAPAAFQEMDDRDKLKSSSYVRRKGGVAAQGSELLQTDQMLGREVRYEEIVSDSDPEAPTRRSGARSHRSLFERLVPGGAVGRSAQAQRRKVVAERSDVVQSREETFAVVDGRTLQAAGPGTVELTRPQAEQRMQELKASGQTSIDIVPTYQLVREA
jgi:hypothetical protein